MNEYLADGNVLVALTVIEHFHHEAASAWFEQAEPNVATCPITEGTLLRFLLREGQVASDSIGVLDAMRSQAWHRFWPDSIPYKREQVSGVLGHRQITDAYLVALARHNAARIVTFDKGLAALHGEKVHLLGV